jgi:RNA polymerase sigma factor (sigma-70 family)
MDKARVKKESVSVSNVDRASEIFSEHSDFILAVIRYQTGNDALSDDLFQDFFLSLVSRPVPPGIQNIKSYLYRAIVNDVVDAMRRVRNYQGLMQKYAECFNYSVNKNSPENALTETEEMSKMLKLIEGCLPRSGAQAITLRYRDNYNTKEIAEKMKVNNRTVHRYISVGLNKARQFLKAKRG